MQQRDRGLVLLFSRSYRPEAGVVETVVHSMAAQLLRQGFHIRLFTSGDRDSVETPQPGITVVRVADRLVAGRRAGFISWWLTQHHISQLLRREIERPIAVHVFDAAFGLSAVNWARKNGVRSVVTLTGDDVLTESRSLAKRFLVRRSLRRAGLVTSPSRLLAHMAADSGDRTNIHIVPHGIDFTAAAGVENALHIRRRFGIPADAFVFLSIQRLYPGQTPVNAVRAFARATLDRQHTYMLIAGEGPGRAAIERVAAETGAAKRVLVAGAIPPEEVPTYMRASDAFVIDTAFESFGVAAVEAMAAGLPVIATRAGAMPEIVEDGRTGFLSRFGDIDSMANDMRRVMTNPELREHIRAEGRRSAASFDWSSIAEQYTSGYGAA